MSVERPPVELQRAHADELQRLVDGILWVEDRFPEGLPSGWYRSPERNAATPNASPTSLHQLGLAVDLDVLGGDCETLLTLAGIVLAAPFDLSALLEWDTLGSGKPRDIVHVQTRPLLSGERFSFTRSPRFFRDCALGPGAFRFNLGNALPDVDLPIIGDVADLVLEVLERWRFR